MEADSTTPLTAEDNTATEGFPEHLGHQSLASDVVTVEAAVAPLVAAGGTSETISQDAPRCLVSAEHQAVQNTQQWETSDDDDEAVRPSCQESRGTQVEAPV